MNVLLVLWQNCKQKRKCKIENLDMEYYKNLSAVINFDEKTTILELKINYMNDVFFMIVGVIEIFYNLLFMEDQYKSGGRFEDSFETIQLTGMTDQLKDRYLDKIIKCHLEMIDIEYCKKDKIMDRLNLKIPKI